MSDKYFTPDIEDIRVGYECEVKNSSDDKNFEWEHLKIVGVDDAKISGRLMDWSFYDSLNAVKDKSVRVPYLTKEQIIAEGWREIHDEEYIKSIPVEDGMPSKTWWFHNNVDTEYLSTIEFRYNGYHNVGFRGECKDINTFRWISKLLKI